MREAEAEPVNDIVYEEQIKSELEGVRYAQAAEQTLQEENAISVEVPVPFAATEKPKIEITGQPVAIPAPELNLKETSSEPARPIEVPIIGALPATETVTETPKPVSETVIMVDEISSGDPENFIIDSFEEKPVEASVEAAEIDEPLEQDLEQSYDAEIEPAQVKTETVSQIIDSFSENLDVSEENQTVLESLVTVVEYLPEDTQIIMSEYLAEAEPEAVIVIQELLVTMAPIMERYEVLIAEGEAGGFEAEQIEAVIMEWYETVMQVIGQPFEPEKAAQFIAQLQVMILERQAANIESAMDDGTHEHKLGLPNLQTALKLKDGIERELGRLTIRRLTAQLA